MCYRVSLGIFFSLLIVLNGYADELVLNPNHPERYTVVKGDTLWDLSAQFLKDPWRWGEIWKRNPAIENPDLIYPGDIIALSFVDGKPQLTVQRGTVNQNDRLTPQIRVSPMDEAIPLIPVDAIKQFLTRPRIVDPGQLESAPYIVGFADEHLIGGAGERIYVRAIEQESAVNYIVYRQGEIYKDPDTDEVLGLEARYIADSQLQRPGDPATLLLTRSDSEVLAGDRLLPAPEEKIHLYYHPRPPSNAVQGHIISVLDGVTQIGQYNVVVIDRGTNDGIEIGHVFDIYQTGVEILDTVSAAPNDTVKLPDEKAGLLLVFRPFERVSYALVMYTRRALHLFDSVRPPSAGW